MSESPVVAVRALRAVHACSSPEVARLGRTSGVASQKTARKGKRRLAAAHGAGARIPPVGHRSWPLLPPHVVLREHMHACIYACVHCYPSDP